MEQMLKDALPANVESSVLFNSSLNAITVLESVKDNEGRIIDFIYTNANPASLRMLGKRREELLGFRFSQIHPSLYKSDIFNSFKKVLENDCPFIHELSYENERIKKWYQQEIMKNGDGLLVITIDSSKSHEASEKLIRSERLLNKAQELTQTGNYHWKLGEELYWSETLYKIHDLEGSAKINLEEYLKRVHPEDIGYYRELFARLFQSPGHFEYSYRIVLNSGRIRKLKGQADSYADEEGKIHEIIGFTQDITESSEIEDALRYETLLKDAIYQAQNDLGIGLSISLGERIIFANEGLCNIYGYSKAQLQALNSFFELIPDDEMPKLKKRMTDRENSVLGSQFLETVILHKQGHRVRIAYASKPVNVGGRKLLVSVIVDITGQTA